MSLATRASVRGGKFSELPVPDPPIAAADPGPAERDRVEDRREGFRSESALEREPEREEEREEDVPPMAEPRLVTRESDEEEAALEKSEPVALVEREDAAAADGADDEED